MLVYLQMALSYIIFFLKSTSTIDEGILVMSFSQSHKSFVQIYSREESVSGRTVAVPLDFPSLPAGSACIVHMHSSSTAPSVCRKNGEALARPLRGLKYAGLLQSPSKQTESSALLCSGRPVLIQPGPREEVN